MEDKEWVLKNEEEICADTRDVDEVCMALEHSTIFATEMIQNLTKTIEALQQENNGWRERYDELDAGHSRLFKDFCKLQQENERLKEQINTAKIGWDTYETYSEQLEQQIAESNKIIEIQQQEIDRLKKKLNEVLHDFYQYVQGGKEICAFCLYDDDCLPGETICGATYKGFKWRGLKESE